MKKLVFVTLIILSSCGKECEMYYNGNQTYKGERGGCYYFDDNDNKKYVDSQYCSCY